MSSPYPWWQFWHWAEYLQVIWYTLLSNLGLEGAKKANRKYSSRPRKIEETKFTGRRGKEIRRRGRHER